MIQEYVQELAGIGEWWAGIKGRILTEKEKIEAFYHAGRMFETETGKLASYRARIAALAAKIRPPLSPDRLKVLQAAHAELSRRQQQLEGGAAGLLGDIKALLARAQAGARGIKGFGALLPVAIPAWLLIAGVGAIAGYLTTRLVDWLTGAEAHSRQLDLAEKMFSEVNAGRMTAQEAQALLEASKPPAPWWESLEKAAPIILLGAVLLWVGPTLKAGGRKR